MSAEIPEADFNVRFTPESGHQPIGPECPLIAEAVEELFSWPSRAILIRGDGNIRNNDSGSSLY